MLGLRTKVMDTAIPPAQQTFNVILRYEARNGAADSLIVSHRPDPAHQCSPKDVACCVTTT